MSEARATHRRVMNMICRGVLATTDDEQGVQLQQVSLLRDEAKTAVERFQNYGFSSNAPGESEVIVVFVSGGRDHGVVVATDDRASRFTGLAAGEVAIYTNEGDSIVLRRDNTIEITTKTLIVNAEETITINTEKFEIEAPEIAIKGDIELDGSLNATGSINAPGGGVGGE
jgi:phage baseplate assembly protein V